MLVTVLKNKHIYGILTKNQPIYRYQIFYNLKYPRHTCWWLVFVFVFLDNYIMISSKCLQETAHTPVTVCLSPLYLLSR